jgi:hypothetical protein
MNELGSVVGQIAGWILSARFFKWVVVYPLALGALLFVGCSAAGLILGR